MTPYIRKLWLSALVRRGVASRGLTWSALSNKRTVPPMRDIEYHNAASHADAEAFARRQQQRARGRHGSF